MINEWGNENENRYWQFDERYDKRKAISRCKVISLIFEISRQFIEYEIDEHLNRRKNKNKEWKSDIDRLLGIKSEIGVKCFIEDEELSDVQHYQEVHIGEDETLADVAVRPVAELVCWRGGVRLDRWLFCYREYRWWCLLWDRYGVNGVVRTDMMYNNKGDMVDI